MCKSSNRKKINCYNRCSLVLHLKLFTPNNEVVDLNLKLWFTVCLLVISIKSSVSIDIHSDIHSHSYVLHNCKNGDIVSAQKPIGICAFQKGKSATERYC